MPWEAIVTVVLAVIGLIISLTKISVVQDMILDKIKEIKNTTVVIEATYVKGTDFSRELGRLDQSVNAAHKRIDLIKLKGGVVDKEIGD